MGLNGETVEGGHGGAKGKMWVELTTAADSIRAALSPIQ
jgi:hypothetical protein